MKIRLIVPNAPLDSRHGQTATKVYGPAIADIAGGFTATQGTGGWKDYNGKLVIEPVTVFDCHFDAGGGDYEPGNIGPCRFRSLAQQIAQDLRQDCVYLEIDGVAEFVRP